MFTSKYVLDTVLLKQQKWSILEIAGFFFRNTQGKAEVISNTANSFVSIVMHLTCTIIVK